MGRVARERVATENDHGAGVARDLAQIVSGPISPFRQVERWPSLVIRRQLLLRVALVLIVVNPELRMFLRDDCRYLVHGLERGLLAPIVVGDIAMFEAGLEMHSIAKNHRSSFREPHEQRLVSRRMSGSGE